MVRTQSLNARRLPLRITETAPGGAIVFDESQIYDANANVTQLIDHRDGTSSRVLAYDAQDRLRQATGVWGSGSFTYDGADNLLTQVIGLESYSYAYTNQKLSSIAANGGVTIGFSHDARGNVIQKATVGFIWDRANRLARTGDQAYRYDGHGRRTWATTVNGNGEPTGGSTLTLYGRDGQLLYEERTGSAVATGEIFANGFESGAPPAQAETRTYHWLGKALIARREQGSSGTTTTYLTGDVLGSVVAETNASAAVTERTRYQPFGTPMIPRSGPGYTGHVMDRSGLIYMQGRYYDPDVGRFLGMDPVAPSLADGGDFNRYAYARNNPYRYTDSTGQYVETAWDVVNVAIGVRSFGANVAEGNWGAAALDAVGVVVDGLAVAAPLPGGAGTAIHMARAADAVVDAERAADTAATAAKALPALRSQYVADVNALATRVPEMREAGMGSEQIARALHAERRALGEKFKALTPSDKLAEITQRNIQLYGDPLGPSIDWLRAEGRSWEQIIESASRPGGGDLGF